VGVIVSIIGSQHSRSGTCTNEGEATDTKEGENLFTKGSGDSSQVIIEPWARRPPTKIWVKSLGWKDQIEKQILSIAKAKHHTGPLNKWVQEAETRLGCQIIRMRKPAKLDRNEKRKEKPGKGDAP